MSFKQDCPFCGQTMDVPDELDGEVSNCPGCGQEVCFSRESSEGGAGRTSAAPLAVAAAVAARRDIMPEVTWSWAFDFVLKITVAAAVIDGVLVAAFLVLRALAHP